MKKFTKKNVIQKIIFAVLIIVLCSIMIPNYVHADITVEPKGGGTLFNPVKNLLTAIGDAFLNLIQSTVFTQDGSKMSAAAEGLTFSVSPGDKARDGGNWWDDSNDNNVAYPGYLYLTPEAIFSNKISILDADFVNPIENYDEYIDGNKYEDGITKLRKTIAKWYVGLRNFALVGLLSVLVYVGIRIILSSTAGEKAKYKQMITYWVSAIALLFMLHYIMSFTFLITDKITQIFSGLNGNKAITTQNVGKEGGDNTFTINDDSDETKFSSFLSGEYNDIQGQILSGDKITGVANLTQYARLYANITGTVGFRYLVVYIALVAYTVYFFFIYTKRVIYVAFLTLIAPLITLTYPIDKLNDGQAQAFNVWIKEFVFNVLLQPFHLLIYTIFIGMAIDFANSNLVYTIVAIAFIIPAEKLLRKMFGFDKASTSNAFSGAAAGSMLATAISKAGGKVAGSGNKGGSGDKGGSSDSDKDTSETNSKKDGYKTYQTNNGMPEGENNNNADNNAKNTDNSTANNQTNINNNNETNTDDDVPEWRDDLTPEEINDRDDLLTQKRASEAFAEEDRENNDYESADQMERQAEEQDRQLDKYRQPHLDEAGMQGDETSHLSDKDTSETNSKKDGYKTYQTNNGMPEGENNNNADNNAKNTDNSTANNQTNINNNNETDTDNDVPKWRDDLTDEEIADRDDLLNQKMDLEASAEEKRQNEDDESTDEADEMERQAKEKDRQLDRYRQAEDEDDDEEEDKIRQQEDEEEDEDEDEDEEDEDEDEEEEDEDEDEEKEDEDEDDEEEDKDKQDKNQTQKPAQQQASEEQRKSVQPKTEKEKSRGQRIRDGLMGVVKSDARKIGDKTGMRLSEMHGFKDMTSKERASAIGRQMWNGTKTMLPRALKAGTRYALAGSAALLAGSAALISGDPKSVLSAATLAGKGGADIGRKLGDKVESGITSRSNTFARDYYGKDYKKVQQEKENRKFMNDSKEIEAYKEHFGDEKDKEGIPMYRRAMEQGLIMKNDYGTTNRKDIFAALDLTSEFGGKEPEEAIDLENAISIQALSKQTSDEVFEDREKYDDKLNNIQKRFIKGGLEPADARRRAEKCLKDIAKIKGKTIPASNKEIKQMKKNDKLDVGESGSSGRQRSSVSRNNSTQQIDSEPIGQNLSQQRNNNSRRGNPPQQKSSSSKQENSVPQMGSGSGDRGSTPPQNNNGNVSPTPQNKHNKNGGN